MQQYLMQAKVPPGELEARMRRFREGMDRRHPDWGVAIISSRVNLYYFTGTIQDGVLVIPNNGEAVFWVRRSYPRAMDESAFPQIRQMQSYRSAAEALGKAHGVLYLEKDQVSLGMYERLRKHFACTSTVGIDGVLAGIRSIKSRYELGLMEKSGEIHRRVLEDLVPGILREGMSEAELSTGLYALMVEEGHHGIVRFGMSETEVLLGLIGFGESSIYPTFLDSPGGNAGMSPAVPLLGSRHRKLKKGDLVFIDIGCGYHGYHTDKTMTYVYGGALSDEVTGIHKQCVGIQDAVARRLRPGEIPSKIYQDIMGTLEPEFLENFMGFQDRKVQFLGHGIGLEIAENPVIAKGFDEPIQEGMVFALEPKKGIPGIGMVGIENTFVVTPGGGRSITGRHPGLMRVG
jgi:Xaa-Pro aminopeptidase